MECFLFHPQVQASIEVRRIIFQDNISISCPVRLLTLELALAIYIVSFSAADEKEAHEQRSTMQVRRKPVSALTLLLKWFGFAQVPDLVRAMSTNALRTKVSSLPLLSKVRCLFLPEFLMCTMA